MAAPLNTPTETGHYCAYAHTACTCRPRVFCRDGLIAVPSEDGPELMSCPFTNCACREVA